MEDPVLSDKICLHCVLDSRVCLLLVKANFRLHELLEFTHDVHVHLFKIISLKSDKLYFFLKLFLFQTLFTYLLSHLGKLTYITLDL